jgi:hypothetical protein
LVDDLDAPFDDPAFLVDVCRKHDDVGDIRADSNVEIATLIEAVAEAQTEPPMLLFDSGKDRGPEYSVARLICASARRVAIALGLPPEANRPTLGSSAAANLEHATPIPPRAVSDGFVLPNQSTGGDLDSQVPVAFVHRQHSGRYLCSGNTVMTRDPEPAVRPVRQVTADHPRLCGSAQTGGRKNRGHLGLGSLGRSLDRTRGGR